MKFSFHHCSGKAYHHCRPRVSWAILIVQDLVRSSSDCINPFEDPDRITCFHLPCPCSSIGHSTCNLLNHFLECRHYQIVLHLRPFLDFLSQSVHEGSIIPLENPQTSVLQSQVFLVELYWLVATSSLFFKLVALPAFLIDFDAFEHWFLLAVDRKSLYLSRCVSDPQQFCQALWEVASPHQGEVFSCRFPSSLWYPVTIFIATRLSSFCLMALFLSCAYFL